MARPPKFSDEQRAAIVRAQLDDGMTSADAVRAAAAGELEIEPFEMSEARARQFAADAERDARAEQMASAERAEPGRIASLVDLEFKLIENELKRMADAQAEGEEIDLDRLRQIGKATYEVQRAADGGRRRARTAHQPPKDAPQGSPTLKLIREMLSRDQDAAAVNGAS